MIVWSQSNIPALPQVAPGRYPAGTAPPGSSQQGGQASAYAQSVASTHIDDTRPEFHRFPPAFTIRKGMNIPCTPPMPIDTQLAGPLYCITDADVLSMDLTNVLLPAGSQINLQMERGLGLGNDRAILVATDVLTTGPNYLAIPLDAIGAASNGQMGVPVDVQPHTWEKLKATVALVALEGISSAATASLQHGGGSQYNFGSISGVGQSLGQTAFQHDLQIPTTGYRGAGRSVSVYMNHYLDLSEYYENVQATR